ncbi:MAG: hypothetical protein ACE5OZ_01305 [Candidatus Heimdallarchaeota archaeon]
MSDLKDILDHIKSYQYLGEIGDGIGKFSNLLKSAQVSSKDIYALTCVLKCRDELEHPLVTAEILEKIFSLSLSEQKGFQRFLQRTMNLERFKAIFEFETALRNVQSEFLISKLDELASRVFLDGFGDPDRYAKRREWLIGINWILARDSSLNPEEVSKDLKNRLFELITFIEREIGLESIQLLNFLCKGGIFGEDEAGKIALWLAKQGQWNRLEELLRYIRNFGAYNSKISKAILTNENFQEVVFKGARSNRRYALIRHYIKRNPVLLSDPTWFDRIFFDKAKMDHVVLELMLFMLLKEPGLFQAWFSIHPLQQDLQSKAYSKASFSRYWISDLLKVQDAGPHLFNAFVDQIIELDWKVSLKAETLCKLISERYSFDVTGINEDGQVETKIGKPVPSDFEELLRDKVIPWAKAKNGRLQIKLDPNQKSKSLIENQLLLFSLMIPRSPPKEPSEEIKQIYPITWQWTSGLPQDHPTHFLFEDADKTPPAESKDVFELTVTELMEGPNIESARSKLQIIETLLGQSNHQMFRKMNRILERLEKKDEFNSALGEILGIALLENVASKQSVVLEGERSGSEKRLDMIFTCNENGTRIGLEIWTPQPTRLDTALPFTSRTIPLGVSVYLDHLKDKIVEGKDLTIDPELPVIIGIFDPSACFSEPDFKSFLIEDWKYISAILHMWFDGNLILNLVPSEYSAYPLPSFFKKKLLVDENPTVNLDTFSQ